MVTDTYSTGHGGSIYGGMNAPVGRPAWRTAMAVNTWAQVPGNTLSAIDPEANAAINPNGTSSAPWHGTDGQVGICYAWCGAAWDENTGTLWLPLQGGHGDYAGNEPYKNTIASASPNWSMLRNPSGAIGNTIVLNDGQEATGVYAGDGRLRPGHSYNNNLYVPGLGPVISRVIGPYISGQADMRKAYLLNETTGEATLLIDYSALGSYCGTGNGGSCYDSTRNCIWNLGVGDARLTKLDLTAKTGSFVITDNNYAGQYAKLIYLPEYDLLAVFHSGGAGYMTQFFLWDLTNNYAIIQPTLTGSWSAGLSNSPGQYGVGWDGTRFYIWDNSSNTTEISTLTPSGNPRTSSWTKGVISAASSNTVTPTTHQGAGTYGRFGYSKKLGGCYLLNAVNQPVYFYATE